jgi:hypothetical protein
MTHDSIREWCRKFGAEFAKRLRRQRPRPGDIWHLDAIAVMIAVTGFIDTESISTADAGETDSNWRCARCGRWSLRIC